MSKFALISGSDCIRYIGIDAEVKSLPMYRDICHPLTRTFAERYASVTRLICASKFSVMLVSTMCTVLNILQSIIRPYPVYVVNFIRPDSMNVQPCKPVRFIDSSLDCQVDIPLVIDPSRNTSDFCIRASTNQISEQASIWTIVNKTLEFGLGYYRFRHCNLLNRLPMFRGGMRQHPALSLYHGGV